MTLLEAAESLGIVELAAVSWIIVRSLHKHHEAVFTMALLLPFSDPLLGVELHGGERRFWPDRSRVLESREPIEDQISELHRSRLLGNLASQLLRTNETPPLWIIETHAGSREERLSWLRSVITMEGRSPIG